IMTKGRVRDLVGVFPYYLCARGLFGLRWQAQRDTGLMPAFPVAEKSALAAEAALATSLQDNRKQRARCPLAPSQNGYATTRINTAPLASGQRFPGCESRRVLRPRLRPVTSRWRRQVFGKQPQKISSAAAVWS